MPVAAVVPLTRGQEHNTRAWIFGDCTLSTFCQTELVKLFRAKGSMIPTLECSIIIIGSARIYMLSRNTKGHDGFPPTSISSINVSLPLHPTGLKGRFMNWEYGVHGILGIPHVHILVARACQARLVTWIPSPLIAACP